MARAPRQELPNGVYHVGTRGVLQTSIFFDEDDRRFFAGLLERTQHRFEWILHAYCQMVNHYHLVVQTPKPNLSAGMHRLNWLYALEFNRRYRRTGHLFEQRFWSRVIESEEHLVDVGRYVLANPVRAGLCERATDWPWSGGTLLTDGIDA